MFVQYVRDPLVSVLFVFYIRSKNKAMVQVYNFHLSVKVKMADSVRPLTSIDYYDKDQCYDDMLMVIKYLQNLRLHVVGYYIDYKFIMD